MDTCSCCRISTSCRSGCILDVGAYSGLHPDPTAIAELDRRGTAVECLHTHQAVRRYGKLDERPTVAALHLTC